MTLLLNHKIKVIIPDDFLVDIDNLYWVNKIIKEKSWDLSLIPLRFYSIIQIWLHTSRVEI